MGWELKVYCRTDDVVTRLGDIAKDMEKDLDEWRASITEQRQLYYRLSYFTTRQLLALRRELGCFKDDDRSESPIKPEVMALLQSISRNIIPHEVKETLLRIIAVIDDQDSLDESSQDMLTVQYDAGKKHSHNRHKIMDSYKGDSQMSSENEKNLSGSKILGQIMDDEATSHLPKPQLTKSELTDTQQVILANIKQNSKFSTNLVLLAFDRCAKADDEDVIEEWCLEHSADYPYPDSDGEDDRTSIAGDISDNDDASSRSTMDYEGSARDNDPKHASDNDRTTTSGAGSIRVRELIPIDESHPTVIDLVSAGFDLRQSIDAVVQFPNDEIAALEYLNEGKGDGGLFSSELTTEELFDSSYLAALPEVISDGFSLEEPLVDFQRQDSAMSDGSQSL